jgi:hypothetical protein
MKSTTHLHTLIVSLSKKEKNYVLRFFTIASPSQQKRYVMLFEVLSRQAKYDEKEAMLELNLNPKKFAVTKNYLQNQVFAALRLFHQTTNQETIILDYATDAEILISKGLYKLASNRITLAKKIANHLHVPHAKTRINDVETTLVLQEPNQLGMKVRQIEKQTVESTRSLEQEGLLSSYQALLKNLNMNCCYDESFSPEITEVLEYLEIKYFQMENEEYEPIAATVKLLVGLCAHIKFDTDHMLERLLLAECFPIQSRGIQVDIGESLWWAATTLLEEGKPKYADTLRKVLKKWNRSSKFPDECFLAPWYVLNLRLFLESGTREEVKDASILASRFLNERKNWPNTTNSLQFEIRYWVILTYIMAGKFDAALREINWYSTSSIAFQVPEQMAVAVGLWELVCLFETGGYDQLGNRNKKLLLTIQKCKKLHEHELIFINCMRRVRLFHSLDAESRFYENNLENVYRSTCANRYLLVGGKPVTIAWLETRLGNTN